MANSQKHESAIRAKLRLKEVIDTDRDSSKNDLNKKPKITRSKEHITKTLSLDDFLPEKEDDLKADDIIRLDKEPDDKL